MKDKELHHPHDKFFKAVFSEIEAAQALIKMALAPRILAFLEWEKLHLEKASYINNELKEYFSDLVYSCPAKFGADVRVCFILEHKSYVPRFPHIQLGQYLFEGYSRQSREKDKKELNKIIPIVLYHGKKRWEKRHFENYFSKTSPALHQYLPSFDFSLIDLSLWSDEQLKILSSGFTAAALLLMKHRLEREFVIENFKEFMVLINQSQGKAVFQKTFLLYSFEMFKFEKEEIDKIMSKMTSSILEEAKNTIEYLRALGKIEGIEKGGYIEAIKTAFRTFQLIPNAELKQIAAIADLEEPLVQTLKIKVWNQPKLEATEILKSLLKEKLETVEQDVLDDILALAKVHE